MVIKSIVGGTINIYLDDNKDIPTYDVTERTIDSIRPELVKVFGSVMQNVHFNIRAVIDREDRYLIYSAVIPICSPNTGDWISLGVKENIAMISNHKNIELINLGMSL